jgi:hypothetical protein
MFFRRIAPQSRTFQANAAREAVKSNPICETTSATDLISAPLLNTIKDKPSCIVEESSLPAELAIRRLGELAARIPVRPSNTGEPGFFAGDIRQRGILKFKYDGADKMRAEVAEILSNPTVIHFFSTHFGERRYAADCQLHRMSAGSCLPEHKHGIDDIFVVFHFCRDYQGGAYFEQHHGERYYPEIKPYSACISRNGVPHGVEEVLLGERIVLVTSWEYSSRKR